MMGTMPVVSASLEGLDDEQREAVLAPRGPLCVLAGAGTGKTRTITRRIAHLVATGHVAPGQVLAVTFTQRAAGEMRNRLRELDDGVGTGSVQAVTFHAAARRQLQYFWPRVVGDTGWKLLDSKFAIVAQAASRLGLQLSTDDVRDLAGEIEWAKASLISPEAYADAVADAARETPLDAGKVADVYAGYETAKTRRDGVVLLDFDDLLLHTAAAIENDAGVAQEFRDRYRCFVVDEYQDVTPLQQRVLTAWLGERDDLTVVGDANQTIYSFTGATPRFLLDFCPPVSRRGGGAARARLPVHAAGGVAGQPGHRRRSRPRRGQQAASGRPTRPRPAPRPSPSTPTRSPRPAPSHRKISALIASGTPAPEIAVLYRINAQSEVYEEALTEAGVPFQVRGGEGFFTRQEIRQALLALHRAAERGIAEDSGLPALVRELLEPLGLTQTAPAGARARERWEALGALAELVDDEVARRPGLDLPGLLAELRLRADARHPPVVQGVTLASLHAAKGLEWDAVFLVGLADGTLPISHALAPRSRQRGRRGGAPAAVRRNHKGACAFGAELGVGAHRGWTAEPPAVAISGRHRSAHEVRRRRGAQAAARPRVGTALPDLQRGAFHARRNHVAPLREMPRRHRRGAPQATQGVAAAHRHRDGRTRVRGVHRQHVDRDRRATARRRRRAGGDPRHRRAQARAVRSRRARPRPRPRDIAFRARVRVCTRTRRGAMYNSARSRHYEGDITAGQKWVVGNGC